MSPDRYIVGKDRLTIERREVRRKELTIEALEGGGTATRELGEREAEQPVLDDEEVGQIAELGVRIEGHYGTPQDTEWAIDSSGTVWMLQSRPVTAAGGESLAEPPAKRGAELVRGLGAAPGAASGPARIVASLDGSGERLADGEVLVAHMTAPDWVPLMRRAAAIVTDSGGMTCHAAIVSRELGIPCVVGTAEATQVLRDGEVVTVDATPGWSPRAPLRPSDQRRPRPAGGGVQPALRSPGPSCSSTSPSPLSWSARRTSTSMGSGCCAPS